MSCSKLLAAASLLFVFGAHAAEDAASAPTAAAAASAPEGARTVCAREMLVGSRIPTRVCRTVDPLQDEINRQETRRLIHQGAPAAAQGINGKSGG